MELTFMGTGGAEGIPCIGCKCKHCEEAKRALLKIKKGQITKKNAELKKRILRKRNSVLIKSGNMNILLDTPPETRYFLNKYDINHISAILFSHKHYDHFSGFKEFEYWDGAINFYGNADVIKIAKDSFKDAKHEKGKRFHKLKPLQTVKLKNLKITPFRVKHKVPTSGFLFEENGKKIVHFSDSNAELTDWHIKQIKNADVVIFHAVTFEKSYIDHISVEDVLDLISCYEVKKIVLTHINHENLPYEKLVKKLAPYKNIVVAYGGMKLKV